MKHSLNGKIGTSHQRIAMLAATGVVLGACSLATSPAAQAATTVTLQYTCSLPIVGSEPLTVSLLWDGAATHRVGQSTQTIPLSASATLGSAATTALNLLGATSVQGTATVSGGVVAPQGTINGAMTMTVPKTAVPNSGPLTVVGTGDLPPATFTKPGAGTLEVGDTFSLSFTPETASGGQTLLGVVNTTCTLDQGQSNVIATFQILPAVTATPSSVATPKTDSPTPSANAKSSNSNGNASVGGAGNVVHAGAGSGSGAGVGSVQVSAASSPAGLKRASTSARPSVSAASASPSTAARQPHPVLVSAHSDLGTTEALAAVGGAVAAGTLAAIIWWLGRRRRKADQASVPAPALPTGELHALVGASHVQLDDGTDRLDVADPPRSPIEASGEPYAPPHRVAAPALACQRLHTRRRQAAVAPHRYRRIHDRHSGGVR